MKSMPTGPLVLVADDESIILDVVTLILRKAGFRVLSAASGAQALQLVKESEEPVSLAVLDVVIPDLNGPDLYQRLRKMNPGMRVLFISGYNVPPAGLPVMRDFLSKPFTSAELLKRVRQVAERPVSQCA